MTMGVGSLSSNRKPEAAEAKVKAGSPCKCAGETDEPPKHKNRYTLAMTKFSLQAGSQKKKKAFQIENK